MCTWATWRWTPSTESVWAHTAGQGKAGRACPETSARPRMVRVCLSKCVFPSTDSLSRRCCSFIIHSLRLSSAISDQCMPPSPPTQPAVMAVSDTELALSWQQGESEGSAPVLHFLVAYIRSVPISWTATCWFNCSNLLPKTHLLSAGSNLRWLIFCCRTSQSEIFLFFFFNDLHIWKHLSRLSQNSSKLFVFKLQSRQRMYVFSPMPVCAFYNASLRTFCKH